MSQQQELLQSHRSIIKNLKTLIIELRQKEKKIASLNRLVSNRQQNTQTKFSSSKPPMQPEFQPSSSSTPQHQTVLNFQQQYDLMKSYLMKKRFTYVYEQCMKFYTKNSGMFTNHEVLLLIKIVFYVLKKRMITKINNSDKLTVDGLGEMYSLMMNVYLSWQAVLMTQMNAEQRAFFSMLFRTQSYHKTTPQLTRPTSDLLFLPKPQNIITGKINLEYKTYNFLKQLLHMTINSLQVMMCCLKVQEIDHLVKSLHQSQKIFGQLEEHLFPVEKLQYFLLKCQIYEYVGNELGLCLKISMKYQFPIGMFHLIHKNLKKWKQAKIVHYCNLLIKVLTVALKNELLTVKDIYILASEIRLLMKVVRKKSLRSFQSINQKSKNPAKNTTDSPTKPNKQRIPNISRQSIHKHQKNTKQTKQSQKQKDHLKHQTLLQYVFHQVSNYLTQQEQLCHIIKVYMSDVYHEYKSLPKNQQVIDELTILADETRKGKKAGKQTSRMIDNQQMANHHNKDKLNFDMKGNRKYKQRQDRQDQEDGNSFYIDGMHSNPTRRRKLVDNLKEKNIIKKNILNVKETKKKLTLTMNKDDRQLLKSTARTATSSMASSRNHQSQGQGIPFGLLTSTLLTNTIQSSSVLTQPLSSPLSLLQQSSSDEEDNSLFYQFESKRRQDINEMNSRYFKAMNSNYMVENTTPDENEQQFTKSIDNDRTGTRRVSEEMEYEQIVMLDEVIKDKVFALLDLEIDSSGQKERQKDKQNDSSSDRSPTKGITKYSTVKLLTSKLLKEVQQLNNHRKLLKSTLSYKSTTIKAQQKYTSLSQHQQFHQQVFQDLQNIYNLKNNLIDKAESCTKLYKKLLKIGDQQRNKTQDSFKKILKKQTYLHQPPGLSVIGQAEEDFEHTQRQQELLPISEYLSNNRPVSILEEKMKQKQLQLKFNLSSLISSSTHQKQITLSQQFDNLRTDIGRNRLNELSNNKGVGMKL